MATAKTSKRTTKTATKRPSATETKGNVVPMNSEISQQLETLRNDLKTLAKTVKDQAVTKVETRTETAKTVATEQKDAAVARYNELTTQAETQIRQNPISSMAMAVGAGFIIGAILRR
jgi:ElaB/YqjD/DUF883 family membrane-anchored ribosome-binding protein